MLEPEREKQLPWNLSLQRFSARTSRTVSLPPQPFPGSGNTRRTEPFPAPFPAPRPHPGAPGGLSQVPAAPPGCRLCPVPWAGPCPRPGSRRDAVCIWEEAPPASVSHPAFPTPRLCSSGFPLVSPLSPGGSAGGQRSVPSIGIPADSVPVYLRHPGGCFESTKAMPSVCFPSVLPQQLSFGHSHLICMILIS